jgi:hypothetical protein
MKDIINPIGQQVLCQNLILALNYYSQIASLPIKLSFLHDATIKL